MKNRILKILFFTFLIYDLTYCISKDPDEDKAYEFGFTIEGMQHRHEKKDVNGIIQGEFGFITADGVYHVTVYATDENGNFRILSMKNIKISPPLDGSPDYGSKQATSTLKKQALEPIQIQKRTDSERVTKSPLQPFTTQPTIKPACAGCGYVTTPKNPQRTPEQIQYENGKLDTSKVQNPSQEFLSKFGISKTTSGKIPSKTLPKEFSLENSDKNLPNNPVPFENPVFQPPSIYPKLSQELETPGVKNENQNYPSLKPSNNPNSLHSTKRNPQVEVTNGRIKIPGNPDIEIKDKYPGMVEGLPPGIQESDITGILYKFNWTVGFQGHYEKGYKNGAKIGGYFANGSDGYSRVVTYIADENGYRAKVKLIHLGLDSPETPKDDKNYELKSFEFVWYPVE